MNPRLAALLALAAVGCFAVGDYLTQRLTVAHFSVVTILGFRTLTGSVILFAYVLVFEHTLSINVTRSLLFYFWAAVFAATIFLYGLAFSAHQLADVYIITALMPMMVLTIEFFRNRDNVRLSSLPPIILMFVAVALPSVYKLLTGHSQLVLSSATIYAFGAAFCHAVWMVVSGIVADDTPGATQAGRALYMFVVAGLLLLFISNTDAAQVAEAWLRGPGSAQLEFLRIANRFDQAIIVGAGCLSAFGVLFFIQALSHDTASNVAPYDYTIPVWGAALTMLAPQRGEETFDVIAATWLAAALIVIGGFWLHRRRTT